MEGYPPRPAPVATRSAAPPGQRAAGSQQPGLDRLVPQAERGRGVLHRQPGEVVQLDHDAQRPGEPGDGAAHLVALEVRHRRSAASATGAVRAASAARRASASRAEDRLRRVRTRFAAIANSHEANEDPSRKDPSER